MFPILTGSDTVLTKAAYNQAGAVIYPTAIATASTSTMTAQFEVQIGGGNGANGMTFALLSPKTASTAVGVHGAGLGIQGMQGMAVVLSTYPEILAGGTLTVSIDGGLVASAHSSLGATSLPAFTASTGGEVDIHTIRDASLTDS
jgi:hypothetical protein